MSRTRKGLLGAGGYGFALVAALVITKLYILATAAGFCSPRRRWNSARSWS